MVTIALERLLKMRQENQCMVTLADEYMALLSDAGLIPPLEEVE